MTLQNYLEDNNLTSLYEQTKNIYKNFWQTVENNELFFKFIHLDLMEICEPIQNLHEKLLELASIENSEKLAKEYINVTFAFFNSNQPPTLLRHPNLLPLLNQIDLNIIKALDLSDEFLSKLDDSFTQKRISDYQLIRLLNNIYIAENNKLCEKFLTFLLKLTPLEFAKHIMFYTRYDGFLLKVLESNFEIPDDYYLRFTKHHAIGMDHKDSSLFLLDAFYIHEWKKVVISEFFNTFNEDLLETIDKLKIIEFKHPDYEMIIMSLLNLIHHDPLNGFKRIKLLLSFFLTDQTFSPFLTQLKYFSQEEINFIFMKLSEKFTLLPSNFLKLPENVSVTFLKHLMDKEENLFWILEEKNAFHYFLNKDGSIYLDLMHALKTANSDTIYAWLSIFEKNKSIYNNLISLSSLDENTKGFPNLISGIMSIGTHEDISITPNEENVQKFLQEIFVTIDGQTMLKNIGTAIESLDSPIKAKKLVSFMKDKSDLINNISFDEDDEQGLEKSTKIIKFLTPSESNIMKKVAKNFFGQPSAQKMVDKLFYQDIKGSLQITEGFLKSVEKNSSHENILTDINSFTCMEAGDPFMFVRMLERVSGPHLALDKFDTWFKDSLQEREELIEKMCSMGDQLETFIINFANESQVGDIFQSLRTVKSKSTKLHDALLTVFSRIPTDDFQELQPLIEERVLHTIKHKDVLHAVNSTDIDYDRAKFFLTSLSPNLIEALHEAFEGEDDFNQTLKFITNILNKEFIVEALSKFTIFEAKLLIQAFAKNDIFMSYALQTINDFGFEGDNEKIKTLIKEFLFTEPTPVNQKKGVDPLPIKTCEQFVHIIADVTDKDLWEQLSFPGTILAFEKVLNTQQNKKITKTLLKDETFLFVLSVIKEKEKLLKYLCDIYQEAEHIYLDPIYTAHLILFDIVGIKIEGAFRYLNENLQIQSMLKSYIDPHLDPSSRLLICTIKMMYENGYQYIEIFLKILDQNMGMQEALCRVCHWKINDPDDLLGLFNWIKIKFIKGNDKFRFPKEANIVIQDDFLAQWLEVAKTT